MSCDTLNRFVSYIRQRGNSIATAICNVRMARARDFQTHEVGALAKAACRHGGACWVKVSAGARQRFPPVRNQPSMQLLSLAEGNHTPAR